MTAPEKVVTLRSTLLNPVALSRRHLLQLGGAAVAAQALAPHAVSAQETPRRGGVFRIRGEEPTSGFDPHLVVNHHRIATNLSFTHSRLVKVKAGLTVAPGTLPLEPDLAESWSQPNDRTYVFKLRRGVRWHNKPPVNGRELTADDVKYTYDRFLQVKGNPNRSTLGSIERIDVLDRSTVRFTLAEPFGWFLDYLANTVTWIVPREAVEHFGDLRRAEACIGTGPWMLERYDPNVRVSFVRNPSYFIPGQPHIDRVELVVDEDNASRMAAFLAGKYDLGWEFPGIVNRVDWAQIKDTLRQRRPTLKVVEAPTNVMARIIMRTDKAPFTDARVRQAISLALNRQTIIDATFEGVGVLNGAVPAALKDWMLPVDRLGEGAKFYRHDPAQAKKLLAAAGHPNGFSTTMDFHSYGSTILVDQMQLVLNDLKAIGIDVKLNQKEYGAYVSTVGVGKYDAMAMGPQQPFLDPDGYLYSSYAPDSIRNIGHVNDPVATDLLVRQRRTADVAKRREVVNELQRYLATQQHYVHLPSAIAIYVWDGALKNYGPNLGYDYGGRLQAAWLER